jgi:hypothetical protein
LSSSANESVKPCYIRDLALSYTSSLATGDGASCFVVILRQIADQAASLAFASGRIF